MNVHSRKLNHCVHFYPVSNVVYPGQNHNFLCPTHFSQVQISSLLFRRNSFVYFSKLAKSGNNAVNFLQNDKSSFLSFKASAEYCWPEYTLVCELRIYLLKVL